MQNVINIRHASVILFDFMIYETATSNSIKTGKPIIVTPIIMTSFLLVKEITKNK